MKKVKILLAIITLLAFAVCQCTQKKSLTIKIGVINPMTGDFAVYGKPVQEGMIMAKEEINNKGGIKGIKIELIFEDDAGDPSKTTNALNKLINVDKVPIVLGPLSSGTSLAAAPISEKSKTVQISTLAGTPALTNAGDYIFRIYPSSVVGAKYTAEEAFEMVSPKNVAILIPLNTVGKASAEIYKEECEKRNIKIGVSESYIDGDKDFRTQLIKIKQAKVDLILCSAYWGDGGNILKQMTEMNMQIPVFGEDGWHGALSTIVNSKILKNLYFADLYFGMNVDNKLMQEFISKYEEKYTKKATTYAATGYDAVYLAKEAIEKCSYNGTALKNFLYNIDYTGATGHIKFDQNGDNKSVSFAIYQLDSLDNAILIKK